MYTLLCEHVAHLNTNADDVLKALLSDTLSDIVDMETCTTGYIKCHMASLHIHNMDDSDMWSQLLIKNAKFSILKDFLLKSRYFSACLDMHSTGDYSMWLRLLTRNLKFSIRKSFPLKNGSFSSPAAEVLFLTQPCSEGPTMVFSGFDTTTPCRIRICRVPSWHPWAFCKK